MKLKIILISACIWLLALATLFFSIQLFLTQSLKPLILFGLFLINFLLISACISTLTIAILYIWRKFTTK